MSQRSRSIGVETSSTILERIVNNDQDAWQTFYSVYAAAIHGYCLVSGCSAEMAADVVQETLVSLFKALPRFEYRPEKARFRAFLRKIIDARLRDALRRQKVQQDLVQTQDPDDLQKRHSAPQSELEKIWETEWEMSIMVRAMDCVRLRVNERTYESFVLYAIQGKPVAEVCEQLGLSVNAVYQHRNRVVAILKEEVDVLKQELRGV